MHSDRTAPSFSASCRCPRSNGLRTKPSGTPGSPCSMARRSPGSTRRSTSCRAGAACCARGIAPWTSPRAVRVRPVDPAAGLGRVRGLRGRSLGPPPPTARARSGARSRSGRQMVAKRGSLTSWDDTTTLEELATFAAVSLQIEGTSVVVSTGSLHDDEWSDEATAFFHGLARHCSVGRGGVPRRGRIALHVSVHARLSSAVRPKRVRRQSRSDVSRHPLPSTASPASSRGTPGRSAEVS